MKRLITAILFASVVFLVTDTAWARFDISRSEVLSTLDKDHPRLMMKKDDLVALRGLHMKDEMLQKCVADVMKQAERDMQRPMLEYKKIGPRLLSVSRECLDRVYSLGFAWRWTGEEKYAARCAENLLTVCAFDDWNPSHFLDVAEMTHAVGVGYDWLYSYMDDETKAKIKAGLIRNGLEAGLTAYEKQWWPRSEHNWNQVCNGGLIVGALAVAESDPEYAEKIIPQAVKSLPRALKSYAPDGAWGEGPGYWSYATHYTAYGICAMQTALNTHFTLLRVPGLAKAGYQPIYMTGPTGYYLNYADSGERKSRKPMAAMFWLARTYGNPLFAAAEHIELAKRPASAQHVIWYAVAPRRARPRGLDRFFDGPVQVAVFRSAWDDPDALFVGFKAGFNQVNHGHLDLGNFEIDALGVRWARDLGSDNYNLPGYWDKKQGGKRWDYYRLNSASHNVIMLGGEHQDALGKSTFVKVETNVDRPRGVVDLTSAYEKFASRVRRGVAMAGDRRAILVQDELTIDNACELAWGMTTDADIETKGSEAVLTLKGKSLVARVLSPTGAKFSVESAEQEKPQKTNKGVRRLMVKLSEAQGPTTVAVLLCPVWGDGKVVETVELEPLSKW